MQLRWRGGAVRTILKRGLEDGCRALWDGIRVSKITDFIRMKADSLTVSVSIIRSGVVPRRAERGIRII